MMLVSAKGGAMRSSLFASAAAFALMLAHPGFAQTPAQPEPHSPSLQTTAPADVTAPTNPTVPAEVQPQRAPGSTAAQSATPPSSEPIQVRADTAALSPAPASTSGSAQMAPQGASGIGHEPVSRVASNIDPADTHSTIAPRLPAPPLGPDASTADLLHAARAALGRNGTGEAQEALERAETRLLDRSTAPSEASVPDNRDAVGLIGRALQAIGHHDMAQATQAIDGALQTPAVMQSASN
jgi:hypothetical protein